MDIRLLDVSYRYGKNVALRAVNWGVGTGVTGLLGPNGAGKSTLMSLLATIRVPSGGTVWVDGMDVSTATGRRQARHRLGFVPQRFGLAGELRLIDTVAYCAWINGVDDKDAPDAARRALGEVGLTERAGDRVRRLSGGQRQRLGIGCALAHDPRLLILDEPTVGLDPSQRLSVRELIAGLGRTRTIVLSSHLLEDISYLCSRVAVLTNGSLVFDGDITAMMGMLEKRQGTDERLGSSLERAYDSMIAEFGDRQ